MAGTVYRAEVTVTRDSTRREFLVVVHLSLLTLLYGLVAVGAEELAKIRIAFVDLFDLLVPVSFGLTVPVADDLRYAVLTYSSGTLYGQLHVRRKLEWQRLCGSHVRLR